MDVKKLGPVLEQIINKMSQNAKKRYETNPAPALAKASFDKVDTAAPYFTMGFGKASCMPKVRIPGKKKYYVGGYRNNNPATGVLDPMMARAVYIDDNSGHGGVVFCAVDCVGLFSVDVTEMRRRLAPFKRRTGCRSINICSTHNHAGIDTMGLWGPLPKSGRDKGFMQCVSDAVVAAVNAAYEDKRDGQLYLGYGEVPREWMRDSRLPEVFSNTFTRLRFEPDDGSREIYFANLASHSESLQGKNSLVSADFPAYIAEEVMRQRGAELAYFVGAIGGLISFFPQHEDNIESTKLTGRNLGNILCSITEEERIEPKISLIRQEFYVEAENPVLIGAAKIGIIPAKPYDLGSGRLNLGLKTEMTYMELGSLKMLLLPGELFPELAYGGYLTAEESAEGKDPSINPKTLCEIAEDEKLLIFGLANDELGYIPTPNDFCLHKELPYIEPARDRLDRRHYEETNSLGPNTSYFIADTFAEIMKTVKNS